MNNRFQEPKEDVLRTLYLTDGKSMNRIAGELGVSVGAVHKYIHKYGIEAREKSSRQEGFKMPKDAVERTRRANLGRKRTPEQKKRLSEAKFKGGVGHKKKRADGYIAIYFPDHRRTTKDGYVMEHDLVAEAGFGVLLKDGECVHHINGIRDDNRLSNLQVLSFREHTGLHTKMRHERGEMKHHTVAVTNLTTGETFDSVRQAANAYGVAPTNISRACRDNKRIKGCAWAYKREEE